ncbi:MAG: carbamoyltransferase [Proteobacteria bacterium]|nr:carbamoyltransferase [Pseudomonadota bacterium]
MNILGISAFYHDSAACLLRDGKIVAAVQEERFTRKKHDSAFPKEAIDYCLEEAGIKPSDLDLVAFYDKPILKFDRILETYFAYAPSGFKLFRMGLPHWLKEKLLLPRMLDEGLGGTYRNRYVFPSHHESHAASAFFPSPFERAAIITMDGVGEWTTASIGIGEGNKIKLLKVMNFPHSLGLLYSAFTYFTGFRVNSGEYKLMGLAPYGNPVYKDLILKELIDLKEDGSFRMDMKHFAYCTYDVMTTKAMDGLFDGPPRSPESEISQREMDMAASIQAVTEEIMLRTVKHAREITQCDKLVMAGGVALNCVGNGKILQAGLVDDLWIQPAAGDAGGALGSAFFVWHQLLNKPRKATGHDTQLGSLLGPEFANDDIQQSLDAQKAVYEKLDEEDLVQRVADAVENAKVVGHMHGRMEFGPRALGNRSIIADARSVEMQSIVNLKIKFRESFRPFAPIVMRDYVHEYFELPHKYDSPYMLMVAQVHPDQKTEVLKDAEGLEKCRVARSTIPAITHVNGSARVQTIDHERHPRVHAIMSRFRDKTGVGVMINTSFNVRGEPIVCTPEDAYRCFMATEMDVLVIGNFYLEKQQQPGTFDREAHLAAFALD